VRRVRLRCGAVIRRHHGVHSNGFRCLDVIDVGGLAGVEATDACSQPGAPGHLAPVILGDAQVGSKLAPVGLRTQLRHSVSAICQYRLAKIPGEPLAGAKREATVVGD